MIKSTVTDFYNLHENMGNFMSVHGTNVMGKASVIIHYNFRVIHDALAEYFTERDKIITKYGTKDENGATIGIPAEDTENMEKAITEINELGSISMELPIMTMDLADLYAVAEVVPSANIGALIWMTNEYQATLKESNINKEEE